MLLEHRVCLVTGAASGIGEATTSRFAAEGATVIATDLSVVHPRQEGSVHWRHQDVRDLEAWQAIVAETVGDHGRIDVLFNCAGLVGSYLGITDIDLADWDAIVAVNMTGVFYGMRTVVPVMQRQGAGSIINMSSIWGVLGASGVAAYQASKGAVTVMTRNAAMTYAKDGIRVNSLHPGLITTPMTMAQDPALSQALVDITPLGRAGRPEEVAAVAAFLASDESSYVTGSQLMVDGGLATA
jgi:NAD(P)-dependent dehydrogenase (short-subunit alcohol dehydrogenase family)